MKCASRWFHYTDILHMMRSQKNVKLDSKSTLGRQNERLNMEIKPCMAQAVRFRPFSVAI
jgi:hypothetical protein